MIINTIYVPMFQLSAHLRVQIMAHVWLQQAVYAHQDIADQTAQYVSSNFDVIRTPMKNYLVVE
jgi:hypothetical protein